MTSIGILDDASNQAVVQLPGRRFPGSVIQGDSLSYLYDLACDAEDRVARSADSELRDTVQELRQLIEGRFHHYDEIIASKGITRPYGVPQWRS